MNERRALAPAQRPQPRRASVAGRSAASARRRGRRHRRAAAGRWADLQRRQAGELPVPVGELRSQRLAREPAALPGGVVGVLDRQLGQRRGLAARGRPRRAPRPRGSRRRATSRRRRCGASSPGRRARGRRAGAGRRGRAARARGRRAARPPRATRSRARRGRSVLGEVGEVLDGQRQLERVGDDLPGDAAIVGEGRAQHLVAADDLAERPCGARRRRVGREADGGGDVVGGAAGLELVEEPEPLLRERGGQGPRAATRSIGGASGPVAVGQGPLDQAGQARRRSAPRRRPAAAPRRRTRSRMRPRSWMARSEWPPSSKKLSWTPIRVDAEHLGPDRGQGLLDRPAGRDEVGALGEPGAGRGRAGPCGRPCRWASAAARRGPRTPRAPCTRAAGPGASAAARRRSECPAPRRAGRRRRRGASRRWRRDGPRRRPRARPDGPPSAASISPSSTRKPRIFTWWSTRPRNSSVPSGRQRARSPVR